MKANYSSHEDEDLVAHNAPLDTLLRERVGKQSPPDLTELVAARHARGDGARIAQRLTANAEIGAPRRTRHLLIAALLLLGVGAVVGTVLTKQLRDKPKPTATAPEAASPDLQDPKPLGQDAFALKVVDHQGGPVQQFRIAILQVSPKGPLVYAPLMKMLDIAKKPKDFAGDFTTISGLPAGRYAVSIRDGMHAMTISDPFEIGKQAPRITVKLNFGGTIRGTLLDEQGIPIANATVRTTAPRIARAQIFQAIQEQVDAVNRVLRSKRTTKTDKDGSFELDKLTYSDYELEILHPDFCTLYSPKRAIGKEPVKLTLTAQRGANVFGKVQLGGGDAASNYVVTLTSRPKDGSGSLSYRVRTDDNGAYRFDVRVPAGDYTLSAHKDKKSTENPFEILLAIKKSQRQFAVKQGQDKHEQNLRLE